MTARPEISFCIATHHGRAQELAVALDSVLAEVDKDLTGRVEVCISDNASSDDTAAIIEERQERAPGTIRYRRNPTDLGASRNILLAAAMARGRAIWLLGSDDALAPGAIHRVVAALRADDETAGVSIRRRLYDSDLIHPSGIVDGADPPLGAPRRLTGREALEDLGLAVTFMSTQIIRTDVWREACQHIGVTRLEASIYPHVWVIANAWLSGRPWRWEPRAIVRARLGNPALPGPSQRSLDGLLTQAIRGAHQLWTGLLDRSDARRQMTRFRRQVFPPGHRDTFAFHRLHDPARARQETVTLALASLRSFWWSRDFWRDTVPMLTLMLIGRPATEEQLAAARSAVRSTQVKATCDTAENRLTLASGDVLRLSCTVINLGPTALRSRPGTPLTVAAQWIDPRSGHLLQVSQRAGLPGHFRVGARRNVTVATVAPLQPGEYELRVSALIEGIGPFEQGAWTRPVRVRSASDEEIA